MTTYVHALEFDTEKCAGRLRCVRVCPTHAIRVKKGKVRVSSSLCIDCGNCLVACPEGTIKPRTDSWEDVEKFKFKVAIVSPTLFGQFPVAIKPAHIIDGLLAIGFDAVHDISIESELINIAIQDYLDEYDGPLPLISSTCPVVVRLIQVAYPDMVGQIIPIEPPREIAGREARKRYSEELGIAPKDIGVIYITPCPAKIVSIKQPAEGAPSNLDLAIGINDLYNPLLSAITHRERDERAGKIVRSKTGLHGISFLHMALTGGQSRELSRIRPMSVAQLPNIIRVFEDIEKGKLRNIDFIEAYSCTAGCIGGAFTVDERFVARAKIYQLVKEAQDGSEHVSREAARLYKKGEYFIRQQFKPRPIQGRRIDWTEKIRRIKAKEEFVKLLPRIDCSLCGAPTCEVFAEDVANGRSKPEDCVLVGENRLELLRKIYAMDYPEITRESED
ncbi:MAG TPA: 4Fe-4S dicluster domain-containing protein [Firmicutes bacterium]|nr:4Fe-4S dicluster domain-containing protein [Bacillota bacterium]